MREEPLCQVRHEYCHEFLAKQDLLVLALENSTDTGTGRGSLLGEGRTKEEEGKGRVAKSWNGMLREGGASPVSRGIGYGRSWKLSGEQKKTWK